MNNDEIKKKVKEIEDRILDGDEDAIIEGFVLLAQVIGESMQTIKEMEKLKKSSKAFDAPLDDKKIN